jgi:DNA-binding response OmpR family regulator
MPSVMGAIQAAPGAERHPTVLIIDDDSASREMCAETFQRAGCYVITAGDGDRGLELALERHPDLILTDLYLPGLAGTEVVEALRDAGVCTPVVIMSGAMDGKLGAFRCGANAYLEKPFDIFQAMRLAKELLGRD